MAKLVSYLKTETKNNISKTLGDVAALQTLLYDMPVIDTSGSLTNSSAVNSASFIINILRMLGISESELIEKLCDLIASDGKKKGFLYSLEWAIKGILLANVKNLFTCSLNPLLPDKVMCSAKVKGSLIEGEGITINLDDIDMFGVLSQSPISKNNGAALYFDAYNSIYKVPGRNKVVTTNKKEVVEAFEERLNILNSYVEDAEKNVSGCTSELDAIVSGTTSFNCLSVKYHYVLLFNIFCKHFVQNYENFKIDEVITTDLYTSDDLIYFAKDYCLDLYNFRESIKHKVKTSEEYTYTIDNEKVEIINDGDDGEYEYFINDIETLIEYYENELNKYNVELNKDKEKYKGENGYNISGISYNFHDENGDQFLKNNINFIYYEWNTDIYKCLCDDIEFAKDAKKNGKTKTYINHFIYDNLEGNDFSGLDGIGNFVDNRFIPAILIDSGNENMVDEYDGASSNLIASYLVYNQNKSNLKDFEANETNFISSQIVSSVTDPSLDTLGLPKEPPDYSANELWKSCDFNAYLWYIIHRGSGELSDRRIYWDNRVNNIDKLSEDSILRRNFFGDENSDVSGSSYQIVTGDDRSTTKRKPILLTEYIESTGNTSNVLKVYVNPFRYANRQFNVKTINHRFNRTVFEFNWDYIYSLKLFESKTFVANILNAISGVKITSNIGFNLNKEIIKGKVKSIIEKMINADDTEYDDCYYNFSNDEYESLIEDAKAKYTGTVINPFGDEYTLENDNISNLLNKIENSATLSEQKTAIYNAFMSYSGSTTDDEEKYSFQFTFGSALVDKLINATILEAAMCILSPKVAILFKINSAIMGDIDPEKNSNFNSDFWDEFINNFPNVIKQVVIQVKDIFVQYLYTYMMSILGPLIESWSLELVKEAIEDYRKQLQGVIENCKISWNKRRTTNFEIDNVTYADIYDQKVKNNTDTCG